MTRSSPRFRFTGPGLFFFFPIGLGFVRSLNSDRRDLTAGQRAVIALKDEEIEAARAKERQREAGKTKLPQKVGEAAEAAKIAAVAWQVNHDYVSSAKWISKQGPLRRDVAQNAPESGEKVATKKQTATVPS